MSANNNNNSNTGSQSNRNIREKTRAQSQLNAKAPPVSLDKFLSAFDSKERGNALIDIDIDFVDRLGSDHHETIRAQQLAANHLDNNGNPLLLDYLTAGVTGGIALGAARKMIISTPNSSSGQNAQFIPIKRTDVHLPKSVIPVMDLIGRTDFNDWVLRMDHNLLKIRQLLIKAIQFFGVNQDFIDHYCVFTPAQLANFQNMANIDPNHIYFDDRDSVDRIKEEALEYIVEQQRTTFQIAIGGVNVDFALPPLPADPNQVNILAWLGTLDPVNHAGHPNFANVMMAGVLMLVDQRWLRNPAAQMQAIDPIFAGTPVAANTPIQLLNACNRHHYTEYLDVAKFNELCVTSFDYYNHVIAQQLRRMIQMVDQGLSEVGSPAQLVSVYEDDLEDVNLPIQRSDISRSVRRANAYLKVSNNSEVIRSSMVALVKGVKLVQDYEIVTNRPLVSIRQECSAKDGKFSN